MDLDSEVSVEFQQKAQGSLPSRREPTAIVQGACLYDERQLCWPRSRECKQSTAKGTDAPR